VIVCVASERRGEFASVLWAGAHGSISPTIADNTAAATWQMAPRTHAHAQEHPDDNVRTHAAPTVVAAASKASQSRRSIMFFKKSGLNSRSTSFTSVASMPGACACACVCARMPVNSHAHNAREDEDAGIGPDERMRGWRAGARLNHKP
jgi:hypothetical protein